MTKHVSALMLVVVIVVSFVLPPSAAGQELTHRVYLPLIMSGARRPTSNQLIDQALARGAIDAETALTYKVFAAFGDARLPAFYQGDDQGVWESHILTEVQRRYDGLSPAAQAALAPFLIPPAYEGSWEQPAPAAAGLAPKITWTHKDGVHARLWWHADSPEDAALADLYIEALDGDIWPALTGLMGRTPISDAGMPHDGGSGKLDIYLAPGLERSYCASHKGCQKTSSYIVLNPYVSDSVLAHEFMHAIHWAYNTHVSCNTKEYDWLAEATAMWA